MPIRTELGRIPPHMLEDIPAEKIPELLESRDGHESLYEHLRSIKVWIDSIYDAMPKNAIDATKGVTIDSTTEFSDYANKIASIPSRSSTYTRPSDWLTLPDSTLCSRSYK